MEPWKSRPDGWARVKIHLPLPRDRSFDRRNARFGIDILSDKSGEYFDIRVPQAQSIELQTLDMRPPARHLLLLVRGGDVGQERYLCGHDERHWFASGVPRSVSTIAGAMRCLRPPEVEHLVQRRVKRAKTLCDAATKPLCDRVNSFSCRKRNWMRRPR